ncbi:hypothetical protein Goari_024044 [Gossypium aridum]|uniref:Uncharacterized protein n=1 Tax=Gossypium aridum TaxID=34290 RepID=A0A7J8X4W3_GOSAI|nr:hypothetical protein [Gossypium aridum]
MVMNLNQGKEDKQTTIDLSEIENQTKGASEVEFRPWMLVEQKSRHNQMDFQVNKVGISSNTRLNSRFATLNREGDFEEIIGGFVENFSRKRFITKETLNNKGKGARVQENYKNKSALKAKVDCLTVLGLENKNGPTAMLGVSAGMEIRLGCSQGGPSSKAIGKAWHASISSKDFASTSGTNNINSPKGDVVEGSHINSKCPSIQTLTTTHFNPTFKEDGGTMVTLNGSVLDLAKHSTMTFKENFEPSKDDVSSGTIKSYGGSGRAGCANIKFPRIVCEYNKEYKPDIASLLETRVSGVFVYGSSDRKKRDEETLCNTL